MCRNKWTINILTNIQQTHKIKQTNIVSDKTYDAGSNAIKNQKSFRNKSTKIIHTEEIQLYHLLVRKKRFKD